MVYPYSIKFEQIPLDRLGSYHFSIKDLHEFRLSTFNLQVRSKNPLVDPSSLPCNKQPLPSAGFCSCVVRLRIVDDGGSDLVTETLKFGEKRWFIDSNLPGSHGISTSSPGTPVLPSDLSIFVDVISPSNTARDHLIVRGYGFPEFRADQPAIANKTE